MAPGPCKFVERVSHITFNAREALRHGKKVFYVTNTGVFALTGAGFELRQVMPGIDIERDILRASAAKIRLPASGRVPGVDTSVLNGRGYALQLRQKPAFAPAGG